MALHLLYTQIFDIDFDLKTFSFIDQNNNTSEEKWVNIINSYTGFKNHKIKTNKNLLNKDFDKFNGRIE